MKSYMANPAEIERKWYVVDADGQVLGRMAAQVASVLRGKNKPEFTPHEDVGDYVIIVNAAKVKVTGRKLDQKIYYHHSEYVGGMKESATLSALLRVYDKNGSEFTESQMSSLELKDSNGVGIQNVMSRLRLYYNREDVLRIYSDGKDKGTVVDILIPYEVENV